jgi:hypothetical protein
VQGRNPRSRLALGCGQKLACPKAVCAIGGAREDKAFFGNDGDFVNVKSDGAAIVTDLTDQ